MTFSAIAFLDSFTKMFSSLGLFQNLPCPERTTCTRPTCIFSHRTDLPPSPSLNIPVNEPKIASSSTQRGLSAAIPAKRSVNASLPESGNGRPLGEPPRKLQKLSPQKALAVPSTSYTSVTFPATILVPMRLTTYADWCPYTQGECSTISSCHPCPTGQLCYPISSIYGSNSIIGNG